MRPVPCKRDICEIIRIKSAEQLGAAEKLGCEDVLPFVMNMAGSVIDCGRCAQGATIIGCEFHSDIDYDRL